MCPKINNYDIVSVCVHVVSLCVCVCVCVCSYVRETSQWPTIFNSFFLCVSYIHVCVLYYYGESPANWLFLEYTMKRD